ncbi:hypothetical protein J4402_00670 [Candidatus Pacearchaeota archaeon]|nr:hypothetical protein [Candidatus Pacearchaeota archaeon]
MRDKSHMEQVERWAEYVRIVPREEWKAKLKEFIDAQIIIGLRFRERLSGTEEGREILKRLREERIKR